MKAKKYFAMILVLTLLTALLTGCGAAEKNNVSQEAVAEDVYAMSDEAMGDTGIPNGAPLPENRKWVITGQIHGETENLDALLDGVYEQVQALGGYVEDQNIHNGTRGSKNRYRSAELTVRVPAERVDDFIAAVAEASNVVSSTKNLEDITLNYVDNQTRLEALKAEEARLLELMESAQDLSDLLEIERRLTDVHYEMERVTSRLRTYDNQIDYATIGLTLEEVREYTPVEPTVWERISGGFTRSLVGVKEGIVNFFVWLIVKSPYLVVWGLAAGLIALVIRTVQNRRGKNHKPTSGTAVPPKPGVPPTSGDNYAPFPPKKEKK